MDWMIFYNEATGDHYLCNGVNTICIEPGDKTDTMLFIDPMESNRELTEAYHKKRKKLFTHDKVRYPIIARGKFVKEDEA